MEKLPKEVLIKGVDKLILSFPRSAPEISEKLLGVWYESLSIYPESYFKAAVKEVILNCKFFPSISEMYNACKKQKRELVY